MDVIFTILSPLIWLLNVLFAIVWWIISYLLWAVLWLLLPFALAAFVAVRIAEKALGPAVVRAWLKKQSLRLGGGAWHRLRRVGFALTALPLRVLAWLVVYTVWHSVISLFWKPRWHPWSRAWAKRWKPAKASKSNKASTSNKAATSKKRANQPDARASTSKAR